MADHPCDGQAAKRDALAIVLSAHPVRVGHDRLPADFIEGNRLRGEAVRGGDWQHQAHALWIAHHPLQRLHPAHRAADHRAQFVDPKVVDQHPLRVDHVLDGDNGKRQGVRSPCLRIRARGAGGAFAATDDVRADHEVLIRVEGVPGPDHHVPPPGAFVFRRMIARDMGISRQRVADQDGIVLRGIQFSIGLIRQRNRPELLSIGKHEFVRPFAEGEVLSFDYPDRSGLHDAPPAIRVILRVGRTSRFALSLPVGQASCLSTPPQTGRMPVLPGGGLGSPPYAIRYPCDAASA